MLFVVPPGESVVAVIEDCTKFPLASHSASRPLVSVPVVVANDVVLPERAPTVGAVPAPPPITGKLAVNAADDAHVDELLKYGMPPEVPATVKPSVPLVEIGEPLIETNPPVNDAPTDVTVPPPVPATAHPVLPLPLLLMYQLPFVRRYIDPGSAVTAPSGVALPAVVEAEPPP